MLKFLKDQSQDFSKIQNQRKCLKFAQELNENVIEVNDFGMLRPPF